MAKLIPLTQGKFATVDDDVYEWASKYKWCANYQRGNWYAVRWTTGPNRKMIYLHREIMKAPDGVQVDHEDRDGLNDQKRNLRPATNAENGRNRGPQANNTSGHKGVTWDKSKGKWRAQIRVDRKLIHLGYFPDPAEAAKAYDSASRERHGDFAFQNLPEEPT